jgi:hypothetical protein
LGGGEGSCAMFKEELKGCKQLGHRAFRRVRRGEWDVVRVTLEVDDVLWGGARKLPRSSPAIPIWKVGLGYSQVVIILPSLEQ